MFFHSFFFKFQFNLKQGSLTAVNLWVLRDLMVVTLSSLADKRTEDKAINVYHVI